MSDLDRFADRMVEGAPQRMADHVKWYRRSGNDVMADALLAALGRAERCRQCGRKLRTAASKAVGIGPECHGRLERTLIPQHDPQAG